ncbi:hypothetical protein [Peterkaempfera sp. SMS 1(5)a]
MLGLCDRWHKLPSEVLAEPAEMLRLLTIAQYERRDDDDGCS